MATPDIITQTILVHYPNVQGIYLFGSCMTEDEWPDSDVDVAILFTPDEAKRERRLSVSK